MLGAFTVLKEDNFPGMMSPKVHQGIDGAPNFRRAMGRDEAQWGWWGGGEAGERRGKGKTWALGSLGRSTCPRPRQPFRLPAPQKLEINPRRRRMGGLPIYGVGMPTSNPVAPFNHLDRN